MKKVVLMGNPNVGKSVVFSRLTGANVIASNYPGTTIDLTKGNMLLGNERVEVIDAPGTYSLTPTNEAEKVSRKVAETAEHIINVVDSTNLERNLYLTLELLEKNIPMVVAMNIWDETKHLGIDIDLKKLEAMLKVPVIPTVALTGEGIKNLVRDLQKAETPIEKDPLGEEEKWIKIGNIIKNVQKVTHRHHTLKDRISEATIRPGTGIPLALLIIFLAFWIVRLVGENLIGYVFEPLFEAYRPLMMMLSGALGGTGFIHDLLIGELVDGNIDFVESMGVLTTGLFVPIGMVLPYITAFYLMLSLMEDSGYLPRLSTLSDNIFHKLGMHGHGIVPVFLGLGCNVPGAMATRNLVSKKQRFISATLLAIAVPCAAQMAMIFGILAPHGVGYILLVFLILISIYLATGLLMNRFVKGESPEIFLEIPPYRRPSLRASVKKTWTRIRGFITEAVPFLFIGVLVVNILYSVGFLGWLADLIGPFTDYWLGLPGEAAPALLVGFLRKDLAVGMLLTLDLTAMQLVIASVILTIYFPCVATFAVLFRELGTRDMVKSTGFMMGTALIVGFLLKIMLLGT